MGIIFEDLMFFAFTIATFVWLIGIWNENKPFSVYEKARAVTYMAAFFIGFIMQIAEYNVIGIILCVAGFLISQFAVAIAFYENYKNTEIPNE